MQKFLVLILLCIGALQASDDYKLKLDDVAYDKINTEMKVIFTLDNSYRFLGDLDEELIEKFPIGASVTIACDPYQKNQYLLCTKTYYGVLFYITDSYPISIPSETLGKLPQIIGIEIDEGIIESNTYVHLDDGTHWRTNHPLFHEVVDIWKVGDRVLISSGLMSYNFINVDAPHEVVRKNLILDARGGSFLWKFTPIYQ